MREVQRHKPHAHLGDTPIKGPPAFILYPLMWHQRTFSTSPDAFAPHRVLTRLKVGRVLSDATVGGLQDAPAPCMASRISLDETLPSRKIPSRVLGVLRSVSL